MQQSSRIDSVEIGYRVENRVGKHTGDMQLKHST